MASENPQPGALLRDTRRRRIGVLMAHHAGRYYLRPQAGGREWEAQREDLEALTPEEALRAKVAEANRRSAAEGAM
jgi:hypothetical protein